MNYKTNNLRKSRFLKVAQIIHLGIIGNGSYLAGGALRTLVDNSEKVDDFDIFFEDGEREDFGLSEPPAIDHPLRVKEVRDILVKEKFKLVFECKKGELYTYKKDGIKIQLITVKFLSPQEMINSFDFGACQAAYDGCDLFFTKAFVHNVKFKKLSTEFVEFPAATIKRMIKYSNKGYNVNGAILDFMEKISGLTFDENGLRLYVD